MGERQQPQFLFDIRHARQGDADGRRPALADGVQQLRAIHAGHADVADDHIVRCRSNCESASAPLSTNVMCHLSVSGCSRRRRSLQHLRFVIDEQHMAHAAAFEFGTLFHEVCISAESRCRAPG